MERLAQSAIDGMFEDGTNSLGDNVKFMEESKSCGKENIGSESDQDEGEDTNDLEGVVRNRRIFKYGTVCNLL